MTTNQIVNGKNDAILVREKNGKAIIDYCKTEDGHAAVEQALQQGSGATLFTFEQGAFEAEFYIKWSSIKDRVDEAVRKLNADLRMRDALNEAGVPQDVELRKKVYKAMQIVAASR